MKQQVTIEVDVPDGWELTGEYRLPRRGEYCLLVCGVHEAAGNFQACRCFILRRASQPVDKVERSAP
jgi:hypothetical protein